VSFLVWVGDWRFWSNLNANFNVDFNAKYNAKSNVHAMLHPSLVLFLEYTWNTFQHWIAFYGMSQKPRKLAGGTALSQPVTKNLAHSTVLYCFSIKILAVVLYLFHFPSILVLLRKRQFSAQLTWFGNGSPSNSNLYCFLILICHFSSISLSFLLHNSLETGRNDPVSLEMDAPYF
jgi:hypothetical protein